MTTSFLSSDTTIQRVRLHSAYYTLHQVRGENDGGTASEDMRTPILGRTVVGNVRWSRSGLRMMCQLWENARRRGWMPTVLAWPVVVGTREEAQVVEETPSEVEGVEISVEVASAIEVTGTSVDSTALVAVAVEGAELSGSSSPSAGLGVASSPHSSAASLSESP